MNATLRVGQSRDLEMRSVRSLPSNVTMEQVASLFSEGGPAGWLRQFRFGPLRAVADVYLPFFLFQVEVENRGRAHKRFLALDAVTGSLDLYGFPEAPDPCGFVEVLTRNAPPPALERRLAASLVTERVRREVFGRGFFRLSKLRISEAVAVDEFHVPYWVGFFGRQHEARIVVVDAVRRSLEGAKVRELITRWLTGQRKTLSNERIVPTDGVAVRHHASSAGRECLPVSKP